MIPNITVYDITLLIHMEGIDLTELNITEVHASQVQEIGNDRKPLDADEPRLCPIGLKFSP